MDGTPIRVLIADDHPIVRHGLVQIVERDTGLTVVGEAGDGVEALARLEELAPHVVVLDIDMPRMGGFDVLREVRARGLAVGAVVLSIHCDEDMFDEAMALGAKGFVVKDGAVTDIVAAVRAAAAGGYFVSPSLAGLVASRSAARSATAKSSPTASLTPTERRVLRLIADYKTSKQIAEELFVHYRTVENHRTNICAKLDLHGSHALIKFALEHKSELV